MKERNALVIGIRNQESVCTAMAMEIKRAGYNIYATYEDEETFASVSRVAKDFGFRKIFKYDARKDEDLSQLAHTLKTEGILLDILVHGISYSTAAGARLNIPLTQVRWEEFTDAVRVGAFSLVELSGALLDRFREGASILTLSLRWSKTGVPGFNVVGATKAALESMVRGLAQSLGKAKGIRVNGLSPGFVHTHSLSRVGNSLSILEQEKNRSPLKRNVRKEEIASLGISLLTNSSITGMIYTIDCGVTIMDFL